MLNRLTNGFMMKLEPGDNKKTLELPSEFFETIKQKTALVILSPDTETVKIIPTESKQIYRLLISLVGKISPNFLRGLKNFFEETQIKTLYTSGLCLKEKECVYEFYCPSELLDKSQLMKKLEKLEGVKNVKIQTLSL